MNLRRSVYVLVPTIVTVAVGAVVGVGSLAVSRPRGAVVSASSFVWSAPSTGAHRREYVLRRAGASLELLDGANRQLLATRLISATRDVSIEGGDDHDNTLTVDLSGGPIPVAGGVNWLAGSRGYNTLALQGGTGSERTSSSGPHSGRIEVGATTINYAEIAPIIDSVPAANFTYNVPHGALQVVVTDGGPQTGCADTMEIAVLGAETDFICNKTNVTINGSGATRSQPITLNEASTPTGLATLLMKGGPRGNSVDVTISPFHVATTIDTGSGKDTIHVDATGTGGTLAINGQGGLDQLTVGSGGTLQGVVTDLTVDSVALRVDDSTTVVHRSFPIGLSATGVSNLAPGQIHYSNLSSLEVDLGGGSPAVEISGIPPGIPTTLRSDSPSAVDLVETDPGGSLKLVDNAAVTVFESFNGFVGSLAAPMSVSGTGATSIDIEGYNDPDSRNFTATATGITGATPAAQSWTAGSVRSVLVDQGTGVYTANVVPAAHTTFTIDGGPRPTPHDRLIVNLTGVHGRRFTATNGAGTSGSWTFSDRAPVHFSHIASPSTTGTGYLIAAANGNVFAAGGAATHGFLATNLFNPVVGIAATSDGGGYWEATRNGEVRAFGDAASFGDLPSLRVNVSNIVAIAPTTDGRGYWMIGSDGGEFAFGDARYHGSIPGLHIQVNNIVGMVAAPSGTGYLLVGSDGGVFAFGTGVPFFGSLPGLHVVVHNIVAILPSPSGSGYDLVGSDGGVFSFGTGVHFFGSLPGRGIVVSDVVGLALTPDTLGYWLAGANGSAYAFGNAHSFPTPSGVAANLPIAAISGT